jgi:uncharacterized membrane protein (UPF0182 family)
MDKNIKSVLIKLIIGAVIFVLAVVLISGYSIYMQYLQVKEVGENFINVFFTNFSTQIIVQVVSFIIVFTIIFISLLIIRRVMLKVDISFSFVKNIFPIAVIAFVFAFFASGFIKASISEKFLMFTNSVSWGTSDPVFNQDISYYVFIRPFLISVIDSLMGVFIFTTIMTAAIYVLLYSKLGIVDFVEIIKVKGITIHTLFNVIILILIKAISYKFRAEDILYSSFSGLSGAGYTEVSVWLKFYQAAPIALIILAFLALIFLYNGKIKTVVATILIYPILFTIAGATALFVQYFIVQPSEIQIEEPYIKRNIEFTRMAYALDKIKESTFQANTNLTTKDLESESKTLENARIIDYDATKVITSQLQGLRNYYEFKDLDISVYNLNGNKTPLTMAARELKKSTEDTISKSYINDKLRYTHGYGIVSSPINQVSGEGQPLFYIKDIPVVSEGNAPQVKQPRIYYGEYKDNFSIVNTSIREFDYLEGEKNIDTVYEGSGGIKLSPMNRFLFSIFNRDYQILVSKFINNDSKILINKNILDRVRKVAPFIRFDDDPYIIIDSEGKTKWIIDGYTQTNQFPYSQEYQKANYIRNSVKAVIDAYDGSVKLYIADPDDKIVQVYNKIYPNTFSTDPIPNDLKYSIKYPEFYFKIQSEILKRYHTLDTTTFYNKSDIWEFSYETYYEEGKRLVEPYYNMMELNDKLNLVLMIPYTIIEKDNMVSWFAAGSDGDSYGELTLYKFPQGKNVYGTMQIEKRIDNNTEISKLMTLWRTGGSSVIRGNMLVIPVKESLLYIEPVYITSGKNNTFPELKMVIASYGDKIAMEPTLKRALEVLFKGTPSTIPTEATTPNTQPTQSPLPTIVPTPSPSSEGKLANQNESLNKVTEAFARVQEAQKQGDWQKFGVAMSELEKLINELK